MSDLTYRPVKHETEANGDFGTTIYILDGEIEIGHIQEEYTHATNLCEYTLRIDGKGVWGADSLEHAKSLAEAHRLNEH